MMYFEEGSLMGNRKCKECGCPVLELVKNKEPAKINVVCFHCGEILETCPNLVDKFLFQKEFEMSTENKMLILSRKVNESIMIGDDIKITITEIHASHIKLGIDAPKDISVVRGELIKKENKKKENQGNQND